MRALVSRAFMARLKPQTRKMSPGFWRLRRRRIIAAAPAEQARALVDPFVTGDHLGHPREAEPEQSEREADRVVHEIVVQRQELAVEQGEVQEAHGEAQGKHVEREMPP